MKKKLSGILAICLALVLVMTGLVPTGMKAVRAEDGSTVSTQESEEPVIEGFHAVLNEDNLFYFSCDSMTNIPSNASYSIEGWLDGSRVSTNSFSTADRLTTVTVALSTLLSSVNAAGDHALSFKLIAKRSSTVFAEAETTMTLHVTQAEAEDAEYTFNPDLFMGKHVFVDLYLANVQYTVSVDTGSARTVAVQRSFTATRITTSKDVVSIDGLNITPVKTGTTTLTFFFDILGVEKTFKVKATVHDQMLTIGRRSIDGFGTLLAGVSHKFELRAALYAYNSTTQQYDLVRDATDETTFSVPSVAFVFYEGNTPVKKNDLVSFSFKKNIMTIKISAEVDEAGLSLQPLLNYYIHGEGCGTSGELGRYDGLGQYAVRTQANVLQLNEDFLFPRKGQTSELNATAYAYNGGKRTELTISRLKIERLENVTAKTKSGAAVAAGEELQGSDLPLTLTGTTNDSALCYITFFADDVTAGSAYLTNDTPGTKSEITLADTTLEYTGKAQKPAVTVKYGSKTLPTDLYDVIYTNNEAIGTAQVTIAFKDSYGRYYYITSKTFKIVPKATSITKISPLSTGLKLTWTKISGVTGYQIYRGSTKIATVKGDATVTYSDKEANTNGTKYTYKIYAYKTVDGTTYKSAASASKSAYFVKPTTVSKIAPLSTGLKLTWKKISGVTGYQVYRDGTKIATVKGDATVTYSDKEASTNGTKYTYKVYAYKTVSGTTYKAAASANKSAYFLKKPTISSLTNKATTKMVVTWGKNAKTTGYEIQYSTKSSFASPTTVKITKATTVTKTITNLTKGKTYYVRIRAYKGTSYSAWSASKKISITK